MIGALKFLKEQAGLYTGAGFMGIQRVYIYIVVCVLVYSSDGCL